MSMTFQHSIFSGGTFIRTGGSDAISKGFEILHGRIAADAFHNSGDRLDAPKCHPNTRLAVLDDIMRWVQDLAQSKDVLWLYGPAGAGKSAIAQTIAELCAELGLLVASFFFFRTSPSRNNEKRLIASIAYQLTIAIPETRPFIGSAVQIDPSIFDKSMETQVETLIIVPLEKACSTAMLAITEKWPRLILIDGLDECNGDSVQHSIIHALSTALLRHRVPLILFVASRPEPHVRSAFNSFDISHHIVLDNSYHPDADIKEFLLNRFKEIKENHLVATFIPESWPPAEIIDRLVQKSSGQFIYASTVMKYLDSPKHSPTKRLDVIIGLIPVSGDAPYKQLDALYTHILSRVENIAEALQIIGFLIFERNGQPTPGFLECLFGFDQGHVYLCLSELHSILDIPLPTANIKPIRMFHASLGDFLVDKLRSGNYYLDEVMVHTDIAQRCLPRISKPVNKRQSIVIDIIGDVIATQYSTLNFAYHCSRASMNSKSLRDNLMQSDLQAWFGQSSRFSDNYLDILFFFQRLEKTDMSGRLFSHVRHSWDQSLLVGLNKYTFKDNGVDLAVILIFPRQWAHRWLKFSSGVQYPDVLQSYFPLEPTNTREREAHCKLFTDFFEDHKRSGKYHINGNVYARTALKCFQHGFSQAHVISPNGQPFATGIMTFYDPKIAGPPREIDISSVLNSLVMLLSMASPLYSLYSILRVRRLWDEPGAYSAAELESLGRLKSALDTYLKKYESNHPFAKWSGTFSRSMCKLHDKADMLLSRSQWKRAAEWNPPCQSGNSQDYPQRIPSHGLPGELTLNLNSPGRVESEGRFVADQR